MTEDLRIFQKWTDATVEAWEVLKKYPKEEKFILANMTRESILMIGTLIDRVNVARGSEAKLRLVEDLDTQISKVKMLFHLAVELKYVSVKTYGFMTGKFVEIGRLLGGWKKTIAGSR